MERCYSCMKPMSEKVCSHCGFDIDKYVLDHNHLKLGTVLNKRYVLGKVLGHGGFGITYIAFDTKFEQPMAIKEYLPKTLANRRDTGEVMTTSPKSDEKFHHFMNRFLDEAKVLAKFNNEPGIVSVQDYFKENGTVYIVMHYIDGTPLDRYLRDKGGKLLYDEAVKIMLPVLRALDKVHKAGLAHRDISPDNIFITHEGEVKLIDFGAAREILDDDKTMSVILKKGYAPIEQYSSKGNQGPWTDVYATAATLYRLITGQKIAEPFERLIEETLIPPSELGIKIDSKAERALLKALKVQVKDRYQTVNAFIDELVFGYESPDDIEDTVLLEDIEPKKKRSILIPIIGGALIIIIGFAIWSSRDIPVADAEVPTQEVSSGEVNYVDGEQVYSIDDFSGKKSDYARNVLVNQEIEYIIDDVYNNDFEAGYVISNTHIGESGKDVIVTLTVSKGAAPVAVASSDSSNDQSTTTNTESTTDTTTETTTDTSTEESSTEPVVFNVEEPGIEVPYERTVDGIKMVVDSDDSKGLFATFEMVEAVDDYSEMELRIIGNKEIHYLAHDLTKGSVLIDIKDYYLSGRDHFSLYLRKPNNSVVVHFEGLPIDDQIVIPRESDKTDYYMTMDAVGNLKVSFRKNQSKYANQMMHIITGQVDPSTNKHAEKFADFYLGSQSEIVLPQDELNFDINGDHVEFFVTFNQNGNMIGSVRDGFRLSETIDYDLVEQIASTNFGDLSEFVRYLSAKDFEFTPTYDGTNGMGLSIRYIGPKPEWINQVEQEMYYYTGTQHIISLHTPFVDNKRWIDLKDGYISGSQIKLSYKLRTSDFDEPFEVIIPVDTSKLVVNDSQKIDFSLSENNGNVVVNIDKNYDSYKGKTLDAYSNGFFFSTTVNSPSIELENKTLDQINDLIITINASGSVYGDVYYPRVAWQDWRNVSSHIK